MKTTWLSFVLFPVVLSGCGFTNNPDTECNSELTKALLVEAISQNSANSAMVFRPIKIDSSPAVDWIGRHECLVTYQTTYDQDVESLLRKLPGAKAKYENDGLKVSGHIVAGQMHFISQPTGYRRAPEIRLEGQSPLLALMADVGRLTEQDQKITEEHKENSEPTEIANAHDVEPEPKEPAIESAHQEIAPSVAIEPSFNCSKASTDIEHEICHSSELSALDLKLAKLYQTALAHSLEKEDIRHAQILWLRGQRNECTNDECLIAAYQRRISQLE